MRCQNACRVNGLARQCRELDTAAGSPRFHRSSQQTARAAVLAAPRLLSGAWQLGGAAAAETQNKKSKARGLAFQASVARPLISHALTAGRSLFLPRLGPCATSCRASQTSRHAYRNNNSCCHRVCEKKLRFLAGKCADRFRPGQDPAGAGPAPRVRRDYAPPWSRSACNLRLRRVVCPRAAAPPGQFQS